MTGMKVGQNSIGDKSCLRTNQLSVLARRVVTSKLLFGEEVVLIDTLSSSSTRHSGSLKQSVSASFSAESAPELVVLDKNEMMRTESYCEVLRNNILPSMRQSNLQYLLADKVITSLN